MMNRRQALIGAALAAAGAASCAGAAAAAATPSRTEILVPFGAGNTTDLLARALAASLSEQLQRPVIVVNTPGAGGAIAIQQLLSGPSDGSRLLLATFPQIVLAPLLNAELHYRHTDFAVLGQVSAEASVVLASMVSRIDSLASLRRATQERRVLSIGVLGAGSSGHLVVLDMERSWGVTLVPVFYKDVAQLRRDLAAGELDLSIVNVGTAADMQRSGQGRALGLADADRSGCFPSLPQLGTEGIVELPSWTGMFAPAAMPAETVSALRVALGAAQRAPGVAAVRAARCSGTPAMEAAQFANSLGPANALWKTRVKSLVQPGRPPKAD